MLRYNCCRMPASIDRMIQEENLRFLDNRDVFCDNYFDFVHDIVSTNVRSRSSASASCGRSNFGQSVSGAAADDFDAMCVDAVKLGILFLFNTYSHLKTRRGAFVQVLIHTVIYSFVQYDQEPPRGGPTGFYPGNFRC